MGIFDNILGRRSGVFSAMNKNTAPRRDMFAVLKAFNDSPILQAIITKIANDISSNPYELYQHRGKKKVLIDDHPALDLLNDSTGFLAVGAQLFLCSAWIDLVGRGGLLKHREGNKITGLWPLPPHWVHEVPASRTGFFKIKNGGLTESVPASDVIWFTRPDPYDPYSSSASFGASLADELDISEFSSKTLKQWFFNDAKPDIIISGEDLTRDQTEILAKRWDEGHGGFWKKFRPFFTGGAKLDIHQLGTDFKNMQLSELREDQRKIIIETFGMPPEIMGSVANSNRATIQGAKHIYTENVLLPRLKLLYSQLNALLIWPEYGSDYQLEFISPVDADREFALEVMRANPGAYTVDEWRALSGHDPIADGRGQVYIVDPSRLPGEYPGDIPGWDISEKTIKKALFGPNDLKGIIQPQILADEANPVLIETVTVFADAMRDEISPTKSTLAIPRPRIIEFVENISGRKIVNVTETTIRGVQEILSECEREGLPIDEVAKRIKAHMKKDTILRAWTIARTETVRAANFGHQMTMEELNIPQKEWLSSRDDRVRDGHEYLDGQVQEVDDPFIGENGEQGMYPGDFEEAEMSINCRCTSLPLMARKATRFDTIEKRTQRWWAHDNKRLQHEIILRKGIIRAFKKWETKILEYLGAQ